MTMEMRILDSYMIKHCLAFLHLFFQVVSSDQKPFTKIPYLRHGRLDGHQVKPTGQPTPGLFMPNMEECIQLLLSLHQWDTAPLQ